MSTEEGQEITQVNQNAAASQLRMRVTEHGGSVYRGHREGIAAPRDTQINTNMKSTFAGVLISLRLFLFAAQPKEFFLDGLWKLEQQRHKCVELRKNV
jgi:hypothetical protein